MILKSETFVLNKLYKMFFLWRILRDTWITESLDLAFHQTTAVLYNLFFCSVACVCRKVIGLDQTQVLIMLWKISILLD
jgi:hypothetical protein